MIPEIRSKYNQNFTPSKYQAFLNHIEQEYNHMPPFRIAETPVFIPDKLKKQLIEACRDIYKVIGRPDFKEISQGAINHPSLQVPAEDYHTRFLQMDFGICKDSDGNLTPQLIELQGFPSLYFFQDQLAKAYARFFDIPSHLSAHPEGKGPDHYLRLLEKVIVGEHEPREVILLDVEPEKQNTYIDFLGAAAHMDIKVLCVSELKKRSRQLYYLDGEGNEVPVKRIYNRVIFDELKHRDDLEREFSFRDEVNAEWVGHPSWFFRISKYTMPLLDSPFVPKSYFFHQLDKRPDDLDRFVLKPLYSFAGSGVKINLSHEDLDRIEDKENYILQEKVHYTPVIETPNEPAKCEIRMMMIWDKEPDERSGYLVNNLVRLSKGLMSGVKYNKDKDWIGASVGFFEQ